MLCYNQGISSYCTFRSIAALDLRELASQTALDLVVGVVVVAVDYSQVVVNLRRGSSEQESFASLE